MDAPLPDKHRLASSLGSVLVLAGLLLLPLGVRIVRADPGDASLMSVDPKLVAEQAEPAPAPRVLPTPGPNPRAVRGAEDRAPIGAIEPGTPGIEIRPGVVLLNTQGYNTVPDMQALDPAALFFERRLAKPPAPAAAPAPPASPDAR